MDVWMISRKELENDLLDIFSALDGLQYQFDWVVSDHQMWYSSDCPESISSRWNWNAFLISGREITEHLQRAYVSFGFGGILSAVPLGTKPKQIWDYVPSWEIDYDAPDYQFQTPLTELEILCYDGYAWVIICKPDLSAQIRERLLQAMPPKEWYPAHTQIRYDEQGNRISVIQ